MYWSHSPHAIDTCQLETRNRRTHSLRLFLCLINCWLTISDLLPIYLLPTPYHTILPPPPPSSSYQSHTPPHHTSQPFISNNALIRPVNHKSKSFSLGTMIAHDSGEMDIRALYEREESELNGVIFGRWVSKRSDWRLLGGSCGDREAWKAED